MLVEWSVELSAEDPILELPWTSDNCGLRYFDLKLQPELLLEIPEACDYPELAEFLSWANSPESPLETAKCDAWTSRNIDAEDEIFGEPCKFGSYIDLLFAGSKRDFTEHEVFVQRLARMLRQAPEMASAAEFIVRRLINRRRPQNEEGLYITFYLYGFGEHEEEAQKRWAIALKLAQNAMKQYFSSKPRA